MASVNPSIEEIPTSNSEYIENSDEKSSILFQNDTLPDPSKTSDDKILLADDAENPSGNTSSLENSKYQEQESQEYDASDVNTLASNSEVDNVQSDSQSKRPTQYVYEPTVDAPRNTEAGNEVKDDESTKRKYKDDQSIQHTGNHSIENCRERYQNSEFDENTLKELQSRTLYVHNLRKDCSYRDVHRFLSEFGPIENIQMRSNKKTGKVAYFAFVTFSTRERAEIAVNEMSGSIFMGRNVKLEFQKSAYRPNRWGDRWQKLNKEPMQHMKSSRSNNYPSDSINMYGDMPKGSAYGNNVNGPVNGPMSSMTNYNHYPGGYGNNAPPSHMPMPMSGYHMHPGFIQNPREVSRDPHTMRQMDVIDMPPWHGGYPMGSSVPYDPRNFHGNNQNSSMMNTGNVYGDPVPPMGYGMNMDTEGYADGGFQEGGFHPSREDEERYHGAPPVRGNMVYGDYPKDSAEYSEGNDHHSMNMRDQPPRWRSNQFGGVHRSRNNMAGGDFPCHMNQEMLQKPMMGGKNPHPSTYGDFPSPSGQMWYPPKGPQENWRHEESRSNRPMPSDSVRGQEGYGMRSSDSGGRYNMHHPNAPSYPPPPGYKGGMLVHSDLTVDEMNEHNDRVGMPSRYIHMKQHDSGYDGGNFNPRGMGNYGSGSHGVPPPGGIDENSDSIRDVPKSHDDQGGRYNNQIYNRKFEFKSYVDWSE